jgi:hypothetical protein
MHRYPVQAVGQADLPKAGMNHRRAYHSGDPLIAAAGDIQHRVLMFLEHVRDRCPVAFRQPGLGLFCDLHVALKQFESDPIPLVGGRNVLVQQGADLRQHVSVWFCDFRPSGPEASRLPRQAFGRRNELGDALILGRNQGDHGQSERGL